MTCELPQFDECRCECHHPVYGIHVAHVAACCDGGKTLAWTAWSSRDGAEMVAKPVEFTGRSPS